MFVIKLKDTDLEFIDKENNGSEYCQSIVKEVKSDKVKSYCVYVSDEKGNAYGLNVTDILMKANIVKGKNQMKRHNYYPFRTQFQSSNGMFYNPDEIKQQMEEQNTNKNSC